MKKDMLLIYNARLVDRNIDQKGAVLLNGGKIEGFATNGFVNKILSDNSIPVFDAKGLTLMPSFIDMHAHFRDPGLTQKEDIVTGSMAAAAGGFGTVVLMPNTSPVVSSLEMAEENNKKAQEAGYTRVIQSVSITKDFDGKSVEHLDKLSCKKVPLITEDGKEVMNSYVMLEGMIKAAKKNIIVSCHCEDPFLAEQAKPLRAKALDCLKKGNKKEAAKLLAEANILLELAEDTATVRNIRLAEEAGCHLHLCHVSTAKCIEEVKRAKERGVNITCEITPHHIGLSGEKAPNIFEIVNPPLRSNENRLALIKALKDGTADVIATDHAPHTQKDKEGGSPGFSGLETAFATCYTTLVKECGFSLKALSSLMSARPAELLGLDNNGLLEEGFDANLVLVDTEEVWTVRGEEFASKGKYTPLEGKKLTGQIKATFYKGNIVYQA